MVENAGDEAILAPVQSVFCDGLDAWRTATALVVPPAGAARVAAERVPMGTASAVGEIEDGRRATRLVGFGPPADVAKESS